MPNQVEKGGRSFILTLYYSISQFHQFKGCELCRNPFEAVNDEDHCERWSLTAETWLKTGSFVISKMLKGNIYGIIQALCLITAWMS